MKTSTFFLFLSFLLSSYSLDAKNQKLTLDHILTDSTSFIKIFGEDGIDETVFSMVETPDGNFLIGGSSSDNSLLVFVSDAGELIWQKEFDFLSGGDEIYDLIIDSEGFLIGNSRLESNGTNQSAIFKYDYLNENLLWTRTFSDPNESRFEGMLEKPNGNYVLFGRVQPINSCDATLVEIDKGTGEMVQVRGFTLDHCEIIINAVIYDNSIFAVGRYTVNGIGITKFRASLSRFDFDGNEIWSKLYTNNPASTARTYMQEIIVDNDKLLLAGRGDINGTEFDDVPIFLYEVNPDNGEFNWAKLYDIPSSSYNRPAKMIAVEDGFYVPGQYNQFGDKDFYLMKTDKQGNPLWAKAYTLYGNQTNAPNFILKGGNLFFSGTIQNSNGIDNDFGFGKLNIDGDLGNESCDLVESIEINMTDYSNSYQENVTLDAFNLTSPLSAKTVVPQDVMMEEKVICFITNTRYVNPAFTKIQIYPNPATTFINIIDENQIVKTVRLKTVDGKTVYSNSYQSKFNLPYLSSGLYFVELIDKNGQTIQVEKIIIKNINRA